MFWRRYLPHMLGIIVLLVMIPTAWAGADWDRDAVYATRVSELKKAIDANAKDADALVDLAAFYLKPLAPRQVEAADGKVRQVMVPLRNEWSGPIKNIYACSWVFRGDPDAALPLLKRALELQPGHKRAVREMAMLYRMKNDLDRMKPYMEAALKNDPSDLDMCRLYLDHRTALAGVLDGQASSLRAPRVWEEDRADGRYRVTQQPSDWDMARASALDDQAQQVRREAIEPLQTLAGSLKGNPQVQTDPALAAKWRLTTAIYLTWIGDLDKSAGTAMAALRYDPTDLDALDFVIDILRGTHTKDKLAEYKTILDRWGGVDSTIVIIHEAPRGPKK